MPSPRRGKGQDAIATDLFMKGKVMERINVWMLAYSAWAKTKFTHPTIQSWLKKYL
jgi:hypothetical protein